MSGAHRIWHPSRACAWQSRPSPHIATRDIGRLDDGSAIAVAQFLVAWECSIALSRQACHGGLETVWRCFVRATCNRCRCGVDRLETRAGYIRPCAMDGALLAFCASSVRQRRQRAGRTNAFALRSAERRHAPTVSSSAWSVVWSPVLLLRLAPSLWDVARACLTHDACACACARACVMTCYMLLARVDYVHRCSPTGPHVAFSRSVPCDTGHSPSDGRRVP